MSQTLFKPTPEITAFIDAVLEESARVYGLHKWAVLAPGKTQLLANTRSIAAQVLRRMTGASLPQIGGIFGRDHTSVLIMLRRGRVERDVQRVLQHVRARFPGPIHWPTSQGKRADSYPSIFLTQEDSDGTEGGSNKTLSGQVNRQEITNAS